MNKYELLQDDKISVKIDTLEIENVKRIKAVKIEPTENGLTVIGGKNNQGKTSILDAIAWGLGGDKLKPSEPQRNGSVVPPHLKFTLSNGLIVERSGKNSTLKVIDPNGNKSGQQLLNSFVEQFALNLPKFLDATAKEKANILLKIIGVGDRLYQLESEETALYNKRHAIGQIADQKMKFAKEMKFFEGVPTETISASELIMQEQEILAKNAENQRLRENAKKLEEQANEISERIQADNKLLTKVLAQLETARKSTAFLHDESTAELEANIANVEEINRKVRANLERQKAELDAKEYQMQYESYTKDIEAIRQERMAMLNNADLPLPGLSVENGELTYKGFKWDNLSGSEQLKVATAVVRKLNPKCGFVLLDKLEQMDLDTLNEFSIWLKQEGLQAIATRVSTGDECSIIIEDGYIKNDSETLQEVKESKKTWKAGEF